MNKSELKEWLQCTPTNINIAEIEKQEREKKHEKLLALKDNYAKEVAKIDREEKSAINKHVQKLNNKKASKFKQDVITSFCKECDKIPCLSFVETEDSDVVAFEYNNEQNKVARNIQVFLNLDSYDYYTRANQVNLHYSINHQEYETIRSNAFKIQSLSSLAKHMKVIQETIQVIQEIENFCQEHSPQEIATHYSLVELRFSNGLELRIYLGEKKVEAINSFSNLQEFRSYLEK